MANQQREISVRDRLCLNRLEQYIHCVQTWKCKSTPKLDTAARTSQNVCPPGCHKAFSHCKLSTQGELHSRPGLKFNFSTPRSTQRRFTLGSREPTFISTRGEFNPEFGTNDSHCSRRNPGRVFCRCCTCALTNDKSQNAMHLHRNT